MQRYFKQQWVDIMYNFKHFDQVLEAVETLSPKAVEAGELLELAYYAGAMARQWEMSIDQLQMELLLAAGYSHIDVDVSWYDIKQGITDGMEATKAFCRLRTGHPARKTK